LKNSWCIEKKALSLHRYPENNLFTLKRLIPIEDIERQPVKVIALFFYMNSQLNNSQFLRPLVLSIATLCESGRAERQATRGRAHN
jgi:hypothetical protein